MASLLNIAKLGNPVLKSLSEIVKKEELETIRSYAQDMIFTLESLGERVGLAAPQVFVKKRFFIYRIPEKTHGRYQTSKNESVPLTVVINPVITPLSSEKKMGWEACISIPGYMGMVERHEHILMKYMDLNGEEKEIEASGFHARVIQHEFDHLDGFCYTDRMKDLSSFSLEEEALSSFEICLEEVA